MLEVVASYNLCIQYAFFEVVSANNDINVLNNSPLFNDLLEDTTLIALFEINGVTYEKWYYLAEKIYPTWATFVKSFRVARDEKQDGHFKRQQEGAQKDVE